MVHRVSATYRVTFPDGTAAKKLSFKATQPTAVAYVLEHEGKWYCVAIHDADKTNWMKSYTKVVAERIT